MSDLPSKIMDIANALASGARSMGSLTTLGLSLADVKHMQLLGLPVIAHNGLLLRAFVPPKKGFTRSGASVTVLAQNGMNYVVAGHVDMPVIDVLLEG